MSNDLYEKANEAFNAATRKGEFQDFSEQTGLRDFIIFDLEMFDKRHQQRLVNAWDVFETAKRFKVILMRHPDFKGLSSESFSNLGIELWEMFKTTPRSYSEFAQRTRLLEQAFYKISQQQQTAAADGLDFYKTEAKLKQKRKETRSFGRKALDWVLLFVPGFWRGAAERQVMDHTRKFRLSDAKEKLARQKEALYDLPYHQHAYDVDVEILMSEFPTRVLEEIKSYDKNNQAGN